MSQWSIEGYHNIVVLTGAGVSVASGLNTYRGPGGLWEKADIARIADSDNLPGTLPDLWKLYRGRRQTALAAAPNAGHLALAQFAEKWAGQKTLTVLTQNVDGLHQKAGSRDVVELHGSAFRTRCMNPACFSEPFADTSLPDAPPVCPVCGDFLRPDVVLFGETLSETVLSRAQAALSLCDLFLSVGTSGVVWPAARFVEIADAYGATTLYVNVAPLDHPQTAWSGSVIGPAEKVLPFLLGVQSPVPYF